MNQTPKRRQMLPALNIKGAQLWKEEGEELANIAALVPENGTIVEIGTGQGGTSAIFHTVTSQKGVKIYTIDVAPSSRAYESLKDTDVEIIAKASSEYAPVWMQKIGRPIDLLFIDGNHNFQYVFGDFNLWVPYLRPSGLVVFHDYDPKERGGLAHFGVRICLDTMLKCKLVDDPIHKYKLLFGRVRSPNKVKLPLHECCLTFVDIGMKIIEIREKILSSSIESGLKILRKREMVFDSVQACYCIDYAFKNNFDYLDAETNSPREFRRWAEILSIYEHGHGISLFPGKVTDIRTPSDATQLSQIIAREQVRLTILSQLLKTFVSWTP